MTANAIDISRRNLLRGKVGNPAALAVRPPWAVDGFESLCNRCDDCINQCEEQIIVRGDGGFPSLDFKRGECSFCGVCAKLCKPRALDQKLGKPWSIKAVVSAKCLSEKGISCRSCGDVCDPRAISFQLRTGGRAALTLETAYCTGCGACVSVCPVNAIQMMQAANTEQRKQLEGAA